MSEDYREFVMRNLHISLHEARKDAIELEEKLFHMVQKYAELMDQNRVLMQENDDLRRKANE